jgi:N-acetylmuramic acid 6-phosphate etherase
MISKENDTEALLKKGFFIDEMETIDALNYLLQDQSSVFTAIKKILPNIDKIVQLMYQHLISNPKSSLIYSGAGTSGRIGVQDGTEIYPTFGWPKERVKYIIAGGNKAVFEAVENAEDNHLLAKEMVENFNINCDDIVIGLSASGNTPFTSEVLRLSSEKKALTIGITNNLDTLLHKHSKHIITIETGKEAVAGSTRLKAGTSQKIVLNLISTLLFTRLGFVKKGMMVNMTPTNAKLRKRKKIIDSILSKIS